jgi:diaminohydroxyphosphoribosylaminopyrimidine deaminase/5-amino-6-(5-phosphoribosylamino)uracil reductase
MHVNILTASSINGIITPGRGRCSHDLVPVLNPPRELWEAKYEIRRRHDAVLVGSGTVLSNDPTMASHSAPGYEVVRATIDSAGRIPADFRFFDGSVRTLVGITGTTPYSYRELLEERGVEAVPCGSGRPELGLFLAGLEERGVRSVVCEGGGILNRALLDQGFVGRIHLLLLEVILDAGSVNLFEGPGLPVPLRLESLERIGESVLLTYSF